jgi:hypothetical protein
MKIKVFAYSEVSLTYKYVLRKETMKEVCTYLITFKLKITLHVTVILIYNTVFV